jgi:hypothetical protein
MSHHGIFKFQGYVIAITMAARYLTEPDFRTAVDEDYRKRH